MWSSSALVGDAVSFHGDEMSCGHPSPRRLFPVKLPLLGRILTPNGPVSFVGSWCLPWCLHNSAKRGLPALHAHCCLGPPGWEGLRKLGGAQPQARLGVSVPHAVPPPPAMTPRASSTRAWNRPDPGQGLGSASRTAGSLPPACPQRPPVYSQGSPPRCLFCFPAEPSKERSCRKCSRTKVTEYAGPRSHACPGLSGVPGARPRGDSSSPHSPGGRARLGREAGALQVRFRVQAPSCFRLTHSAPQGARSPHPDHSGVGVARTPGGHTGKPVFRGL